MDVKDEAEQAVDPRLAAIPDSHGHAKGEHKPYAEERPIPYTARMLFLWFFHACRRGSPRFMMVADHMNYLTFEDPAAVNLVRRALKLAQAGDLFGAAETAGVEVGHAEVVSKGLRRGMRYSIGAEVDNDPRSRPDAQNIVDAMKPDGMVRSVHFLPITHPTHGENWMWAFDNPEFKDLYEIVGTEAVWEIYMATLLDAIEKLPGNIVGHFYVPAVFGHWPEESVLEGYEDRFIDACRERGMAIELNSRYIYKHYLSDEAQLEKFRAVHVRLLSKAKEKGVEIAVGSDAHSPKDQGRAFDAVLAILDEVEINEIAFPIGGRLARVALRATEETMKQYAPPEPEPLPQPPTPEPVPELAAASVPVKAKKPRPSRSKAALAAAAEAASAAREAVGEATDPAVNAPVSESETALEDRPVAGENVAADPVVEANVAADPVADVVPTEAKAEPEPEAPTKSKPAARKKTAAPSPGSEKRGPLEQIVAVAENVFAAVVHAIAPQTETTREAEAQPEAPESKPVAKSARAAVAAKPVPGKTAAGKPAPAKPAPAKPAAAKPGSVTKKTPAKAVTKTTTKAANKKAAPVAKKSAAKKAVAKKKSAPVKVAAKKSAPKPAAKKSAKKAPVKKAVVKKPVPKKAAPAKKAAAKKSAPKSAKRSGAKHAPAKKSPAKKPARRR